jgi:hypothetical protein
LALRLFHRDFDDLLQRHPAVAAHFAREVASRVRDAKVEVWQLALHSAGSENIAGRSPGVLGGRISVRRLWNEIIAGHRGLAILALGSFLGMLGLLRAGVWLLEQLGAELFGYLRIGYTIGFGLLIVSTASSLLRFRASWQRAVATAFGVAFALVANGLSVFLAFDVFYLDMTTRDPNLVFDVHTLYHRNESGGAIAAALLLMILLGLLGRIWRRIGFAVRARLLQR